MQFDCYNSLSLTILLFFHIVSDMSCEYIYDERTVRRRTTAGIIISTLPKNQADGDK